VTKSKYDVLDYRWRARWSRWWNITRPSAARGRNYDTSGGLVDLGIEKAAEARIESVHNLENPPETW
jgi:hypothetical protein